MARFLPLIDPLLAWPIALCMSMLFGAAAANKLRAIAEFCDALQAYRLLPQGGELVAAPVIIGCELLCAVGLWWQAARAPVAILSAGLLLLYAFAIGVNLLRGRRNIDCGCSLGSSRQAIASWMVWRNLALAALSLSLCFPALPRAIGMLDRLDIAGVTLTSIVLFRAAHLILGEFEPRLRHWNGDA
jgi:Methylamine utilisation protein MauE